MPTSMVWGKVPDEYQIADFRRMITSAVQTMHPPLPPAYASELVAKIMGKVDDWEWWQYRWFFDYDEWEIRR